MRYLFLKAFGLVFLILISFFLKAQEIGIGQWRDHLPYKKGIAVEDAGNRVYAATPYAIFYFNKLDNSVSRLSKINGLSDIGISQIAFHSATQSLVIAYSNTNIDIIKGGRIINISDIKRKQIVGNKSINAIFLDANYAYLLCGFGIVVLDLVREEIKDTYYIGANASHVNVLDLTKNDTAFFAATDEGLYTANLNSPNLADYSYWHHVKNTPYPDEAYNFIANFSNKIFLNKVNSGYNTDSLFYYDGIRWHKLEDEFPSDNHSLEVYDNHLYVSRNEDVLIYNLSLGVASKIWSPSQLNVNPSDASLDGDGNVWVSDNRQGLIKTWNNGHSGESITLQSPDFSDVFAMDADGDDLWVAAGAYNSIFAPTYKREGFSSFIDENWTSYSCLNGSCNWPALDTIRDIVDVEINPFDRNNIFVASWNGGVIEIQDGDIQTVYNSSNSSLQSVNIGTIITRTSGIEIDNQNNLWVLNPLVENILSVKTPLDEWHSFNLGSSNSGIETSKLFIDSYNQKWIIPRRAYSLIVFNDNETITNTADDEVKTLSSSTGNGQIFASQINCMLQDLDREMWFGTDQGVGVIYSPRNVFGDGNYDMQRILVEWDGYTQYLLETETVTAMSIDAANRKWIGTKSSGVFLLSEDGSEQIHHFTAENSPLISNEIISLAINDKGEVFIGTSKGLVSYLADAAAPSVDGSNSYAYPNPVPPNYSGSIAIKNLVQDANVKITDISGNVVFETRALGGQAIWNGYNFDGQKAHTGVYLVFSSSEDGSVSLVTKILFIN